MTFSSSVKLADLNDFIAPSQACINPEFIPEINQSTVEHGRIELQIEQEPGFTEPNIIKKAAETNVAQVSLADCLACSGCVTSAETVLIEQQSINTLKSNLNTRNKFFVASISTQSLASLAVSYKMSMTKTYMKIVSFLKDQGFEDIVSSAHAEKECLKATNNEFNHLLEASLPMNDTWEAPASSKPSNKIDSQRSLKKSKGFPLITSSCPGWTCYVEKEYPEVIPYLSNVVSSQQLSSIIFQQRHMGKDLYMVSVQPCPDKKLEASRRDFYSESLEKQDVDVVLTTTELLGWMQEENLSTHSEPFGTSVDNLEKIYHFSGQSGGYLDFIFRSTAAIKFGIKIDSNRPLPFKIIRNKDFEEICLQKDGEIVLRFAKVYGFRNIQRIIRKLKQKKCKYHFIEIMACPKGCLNGGGQVKDTAIELEMVEDKFKERPFDCTHESKASIPKYEFRTRFHAIEKDENGLLAKW